MQTCKHLQRQVLVGGGVRSITNGEINVPNMNPGSQEAMISSQSSLPSISFDDKDSD